MPDVPTVELNDGRAIPQLGFGVFQIDPDETDYLCASVNRYFAKQTAPGDVVSSYSGVRPLFDDGHDNASEVTRDYVLRLGTDASPQVLSAFGGKITTYRRLSEHALEKLAPFLPKMGKPWTAGVPLPGGDLPNADFAAFLKTVRQRWMIWGPAFRRAKSTISSTTNGRAASTTSCGDGPSSASMAASRCARRSSTIWLVAIHRRWSSRAESVTVR